MYMLLRKTQRFCPETQVLNGQYSVLCSVRHGMNDETCNIISDCLFTLISCTYMYLLQYMTYLHTSEPLINLFEVVRMHLDNVGDLSVSVSDYFSGTSCQ